MIGITHKQDCCGCHACASVCARQCITMQEDNEGFLYPVVDASICIDCGLCEKVCPVINQDAPRKPLRYMPPRIETRRYADRVPRVASSLHWQKQLSVMAVLSSVPSLTRTGM